MNEFDLEDIIEKGDNRFQLSTLHYAVYMLCEQSPSVVVAVSGYWSHPHSRNEQRRL